MQKNAADRHEDGQPTMEFDLQPHLKNELIELRPLAVADFAELFSVASDPLIWEQHPNKDRYQKERFESYFRGAIESKGALVVLDRKSGKMIGCSRYYEFDRPNKSIAIGYTFLARAYWGTTYNRALKNLMLSHAFAAVAEVLFHVGENNIRSQKAMERLGAERIGSLEKQYYGEPKNLNFVYRLEGRSWNANLAP